MLVPVRKPVVKIFVCTGAETGVGAGAQDELLGPPESVVVGAVLVPVAAALVAAAMSGTRHCAGLSSDMNSYRTLVTSRSTTTVTSCTRVGGMAEIAEGRDWVRVVQ